VGRSGAIALVLRVSGTKKVIGLKTVADHFFEAIQDDNRADIKIDSSGKIWSRLEKAILGEITP